MDKQEKEYRYLYEIPRNSLIRVPVENDVENEAVERSEWIMFHHPDGMFSYCTVDTPEGQKPVHLHVMTPVVKRGDHYELYHLAYDQNPNRKASH